MSTDFNALFAIGPEFRGAAWLRDQLAVEPPSVAASVARYRDRWAPQAWTLEPHDDIARVIGPGGFAVMVAANTAELYHCVHWYAFAADATDRTVVRRVCRTIGVLLGSPRAIYAHELLPHDFAGGATLDLIEADLRARFGAPSATFAALADAELFSPGCWYIDDFGDVVAGV